MIRLWDIAKDLFIKVLWGKKIIMTETKSTPKVPTKRIFPEHQWSQEKLNQWKTEIVEHRQRCQAIFNRLQPELIKTHYNWYIVIEPDSGSYIIEQDEMTLLQKIRKTYPNTKTFLFQINETGVSGTI